MARQPYRPTPKHMYSNDKSLESNHSTGLRRMCFVSKGCSSCTRVFKWGIEKYCSTMYTDIIIIILWHMASLIKDSNSYTLDDNLLLIGKKNLYISWLCGIVAKDGFVVRWRILKGEISNIKRARWNASTTEQYLCDEHRQCQLHHNIRITTVIDCTPCIKIVAFAISEVVDICGWVARATVRRCNLSQWC